MTPPKITLSEDDTHGLHGFRRTMLLLERDAAQDAAQPGRILHFPPRPAEPIRIMDPRPAPASPALCVTAWLLLPVFWGVATFAIVHWVDFKPLHGCLAIANALILGCR